MYKLFWILLIITVLGMQLAATTTVYDMTIPNPIIETKDGYQYIKLNESQICGNPGEPALPYIGIKLLLPNGETANQIIIDKISSERLAGQYQIMPIGIPLPLSKIDKSNSATIPIHDIYSRNAIFPTRADNGVLTQYMNGFPIAFSAVCPFEYNPVTRSLAFSAHIRITVISQPTEEARRALQFQKTDKATTDRLQRIVNNTAQIPRSDSRPTLGYDYIMVVDQSKLTQWQPLKDLYEMKGMSVLMETIQNISQSQTGTDTQMKLRNYLIQAYTDNPLKYVLLCGDSDMIPHRGFYVSVADGAEYTDNDIPADMYYNCIDGNWNNDNDTHWGEMYETDLAPEFALGRICYNNDIEIANQINKIMMYQMNPVENEVKTSLFVGEWLWDGPTWGGDYMDEMIGGSAMNGYTTVGVPPTWNIATLYDRTFGAADSWDSSDILPLLSQGKNLVNHLGHSNTTYNMRLSANQVSANSITNNGVNHNFSVYFSQGCYAGSFDNRDTSPGSYGSDCIAEKFTSISTAAAGMIAHSRYGWGQQGSTNGASQYLHRQYIDAVFGEGIHALGFALVDSKIDNIPFINNQPVMYWVDYETNLLGDPAMMLWTDIPQNISVQTQNPWIVGQNQYQITTNAPNADVKLVKDGVIRFQGVTDLSGEINVVIFGALNPGNYDLFINAVNFYPHHTQINVEASTTPYIICQDIVTNNSDNLVQAGEQFSLSFTLKNIGLVDQIQNGTLTLSTNSSLLTVQNSTINFDALSVQDSTMVTGVFSVLVGNGFADLTAVPVILTAAYDGNVSQTTYNVVLHAPILHVINYQIDNEGSPILPGDNPSFYITIENTGTGRASGVVLLWMNDNAYITLGTQETLVSSIAPGAQLVAQQPLNITVSPDTPIGQTLTINYYLGCENGEGSDGNLAFYVGMLNYTFEQNLDNWTHEAFNAEFTDQWHRESVRSYDGGWSVKFGGNGFVDYSNHAYGAFVSPEIALGQNARLKFFHYIDAEVSSGSAGMAWDGGIVEMSLNGGSWIQITPDSGYPYLCVDNSESPFAANTPMFSGLQDWQEETFSLADHSGNARFRFVFGSDGGVTGEGWYLDNIRVEMDYTAAQDDIIPSSVTLCENFPNPFNPHTTLRFALPAKDKISLEIYNVKGQLVKTLIRQTEFSAGTHSLVWDGTDNQQQSVSSGMYMYRLHSSKSSLSRKMLLLK